MRRVNKNLVGDKHLMKVHDGDRYEEMKGSVVKAEIKSREMFGEKDSVRRKTALNETRERVLLGGRSSCARSLPV